MTLHPFLNDLSNDQVVFLKVQEMAIALNSQVTKLDPVCLHANLLQVIDDTVVVRDVRACRSSQSYVGDLADVRQSVGCAICRLHVARPVPGEIWADDYGVELRAVGDWRIVADHSCRQTTRPSGSSANGYLGAVAYQALKRCVAWLKVDVAFDLYMNVSISRPQIAYIRRSIENSRDLGTGRS
jgi:hypothetical protein